MWEWVALGLEAGAARTAGEVLLMRADILLSICLGRKRLMLLAQGGGAAPATATETRAAPADDLAVTRTGPTTKQVRIASMSSLAALLSGRLTGPGGIA